MSGILNFNGSDTVVNMGDVLGLTSTVVMEATISLNTLSALSMIIQRGSATKVNYHIAVKSDGSLEMRWYNAGWVTVLSDSGLVTTGNIYHVVASINSTANRHKIYLNGNVVASSNATTNLVSSAGENLRVGEDRVGNSPFDGWIKDVAIYNTELSANFVAAHSRGDYTSTSYTPVGKWRLTEGTGSTANDTAGSNDGTISNGTWGTLYGISGTTNNAANIIILNKNDNRIIRVKHVASGSYEVDLFDNTDKVNVAAISDSTDAMESFGNITPITL